MSTLYTSIEKTKNNYRKKNGFVNDYAPNRNTRQIEIRANIFFFLKNMIALCFLQ